MAKQKNKSNEKQKNKSNETQKNSIIKDKSFKKKDVGKRGRLIVRNLPFKCTEENLAEVFGEFGKIIDINLPKHPGNNKARGFGFVDFQSRLSADKASLALSGKEFMGRTIYIERAVSKDRYLNSENNDTVIDKISNGENDGANEAEVTSHKRRDGNAQTKHKIFKNEALSDDNDEEEEAEPENMKIKEEPELKEFNANKDKNETDSPASKQPTLKQPHQISKKKKARIIIRNLSFKTTEEKLKSHFSAFGDIIDLNLLRRIDNKLVGCAFIEFGNRRSAVKAIVGASGKPFLGRPVVVDWAIPVKDFKKVNQTNSKNETDDVKIKEEILSDDESLDSDSKKPDTLEIKSEVKEEDSSEEEDEDEGENDSEDEDSGQDDDNNDDDDYDDEEEEEEEYSNTIKNDKKRKLDVEPEQVKKPRFESHDVSEGRTVFIKNVPFSVTNEELRECVKQFGPIFYALVCVDPVTEHSRGTAFVKFKNQEDAEKCLSAGTSFTLHGTVLDPHPAIDRDKIKEIKEKKKERDKDSRNLYLIKEGVVIAGTPAANGVSVADMSRRLQLEQLKTQMLKNLNMFVSRNRLIIHNLPPSFHDHSLRRLFAKYSKPNAVIQEVRVMRDLKNVDGKGIGKSKEYGFVSFKDHEDALHALRNINNNPNIFSESKRPIVAFSIENKRILNLKQKRLEKSKVNNPLSAEYKLKNEIEGNETGAPNKRKKKEKLKNQKNKGNYENEDRQASFVGFAAKPGVTALRSNYKLKVQAKTHHKNVHQERKEKKKKRKMKPIKAIVKDAGEKKIRANTKKNMKEDTNFSSLVNKYKAQLMSDTARKKWYE